MKNLLSPRHRAVLEELAGRRTLLAFDYDGVLAPVVPALAGAAMSARTRRLLVRVARTWPCAVITGRHFEKALRVVGDAVPHVVGNHGYDHLGPRPVDRATLALVRGWHARLAAELADVPGIGLEEKRSTLAVHYAESPRWRAAERRVLAAVERLPRARLIRAKKLVNVLPEGFPDKGTALVRLLGELRLDVALFVGDDVTDEDAFAVGPPRVVGVRVGPGRSAAPWRLRGRDEVDVLLEALAGLRPAPRGRRAGAPRRAAGGAR